MNQPLPLRIIKLGGSLLDYRPLPERFRDWSENGVAARSLIVAGGGPFAESVRESQRRFQLSDAACHRLCMELLNVTARLVYEILSPSIACDWIDTDQQLRRYLDGGPGSRVGVVATGQLIDRTENTSPERRDRGLPQTWDVTSDSLALLLAIQLQADELVLLKSGPCPGFDWAERADAGYVDRHFPLLADKFAGNIRAVHLRTELT
jgi:hypothetical protein